MRTWKILRSELVRRRLTTKILRPRDISASNGYQKTTKSAQFLKAYQMARRKHRMEQYHGTVLLWHNYHTKMQCSGLWKLLRDPGVSSIDWSNGYRWCWFEYVEYLMKFLERLVQSVGHPKQLCKRYETRVVNWKNILQTNSLQHKCDINGMSKFVRMAR